MFTGIITDLGRLARVERQGDDMKLWVETRLNLAAMEIGASVAHNGCCLTLVEKDLAQGDQGGRFLVEISAETLSKTTLGSWQEGQRINLEGSLKLGDELGGHLVYGHVDGLAEILSITQEGESLRFRFRAPVELASFIASKGSVALDGVSLTVNEVEGRDFGVNIIPHTASVTTFGSYKVGDKVNLEIDMLARYVARLLQQER